jgi:hypothetical protein
MLVVKAIVPAPVVVEVVPAVWVAMLLRPQLVVQAVLAILGLMEIPTQAVAEVVYKALPEHRAAQAIQAAAAVLVLVPHNIMAVMVLKPQAVEVAAQQRWVIQPLHYIHQVLAAAVYLY